MRFKILLLIITALILSSCAISSSYDYDSTINFSQYKTFSFYKDGINRLKLNDLDKARIINDIKAQLQLKGLTETENGDLIVNVRVSSQKIINVDNDTDWGWPWGWGYGWTGDATVTETREGKITVHLVDAKRNILVWEGVANGLNVGNLKGKNREINKAISKIFKNYPPKKK